MRKTILTSLGLLALGAVCVKWFLTENKHVVYVFPTGFRQGFKIVHDSSAPDIKRSISTMTLHFANDGTVKLNDNDWNWMAGQFMAPDYRYEDGTRLTYDIPGTTLPPGPFARFTGYHGVVEANKTPNEYWYGEIGVKAPD